MADLTGYIDANQSSGSYFWEQLSFTGGATNDSIESLIDLLAGVGWTQSGGSLANTIMVPYGWPYHASGTDPCVPDISGAALVGIFAGLYFVFYDPFASTPPQADPTGTFLDGYPVKGVACGATPEQTQANFILLADVDTPWIWTPATMPVSFVGDVPCLVVSAAYLVPMSNVDPSSGPGAWSPNLDNWYVGSTAPTGGGVCMQSAPAPNTGDIIRLRLYELNTNGDFAIDVVMPVGYLVPQTGNGDEYNPGEEDAYGWTWDLSVQFNAVFTISGVSNAVDEPIVVSTELPHGYSVGDNVYINAVGGIPYLQGTFCVASVPTIISFTIAQVITYTFTGTSTDTRTGLTGAAYYNIGAGPYQIAIGLLPYYEYDLGGYALLAGALNVPTEMGPVTIDITGVPTLSPTAIIQTATAHGLTVGDRVRIAGLTEGPTNLNGAWWVASAPSPTTFEISNAPLTFLLGNSNTYSSGATVSDSTHSTGPFTISSIANTDNGPVVFTTSVAHGFIAGDVVVIEGTDVGFDGIFTVGYVPSTTTFEIADQDEGIQEAETAYVSGGTVTSGIFNACFATSQIVGGGFASGNLYDDGQGTAIAAQGIWSDSWNPPRTLARYSVALPVPNLGTAGDGDTIANKPLALAPYVALRIANGQEARIAGTLWDSFIQLQNIPYGTLESYDGVTFVAWASSTAIESFFNATLFLRAQN